MTNTQDAFKQNRARQYDLKALKRAAEEACTEAYGARSSMVGQSVNWADLHCIAAEFIVTDQGDAYYRVIVEEAAPRCERLALFIGEQLEGKGFWDVAVELDW